MVIALVIWSCEDPTTLPVSKIFNGNKLQTAYIDTFSVITSTVQLDTVLTNGSGTVLLGNYHDDKLGDVISSTYFQVGYASSFLPDKQYVFDSAALILPYNHQYNGDTSVAVKLNVYQLSEQMLVRTLPPTSDLKLSVYNSGNGFFNSSVLNHYPNPIISTTVNFTPHKDSLFIKFPYSFGANWFRLAQFDSGQVFSSTYNFLNYFFYGVHINVDPSTGACMAGFKANNVKIRIYYRRYNGDFLTNTSTDFNLQNSSIQFNHIDYDRSTGSASAALKSAQKLQAVSTYETNHEFYLQTGTGLVSRLDFPSLKDFFSLNNGIAINAAYLEIYPLRGSYPAYALPPTSLSLFTTDNSSIPLSTIGNGSASIQYDQEFGINTLYRFQLFPYLFSQLKSNANYVVPLILGPSLSVGVQGSSVHSAYMGDRFHADTKIIMKIYYSYPLN